MIVADDISSSSKRTFDHDKNTGVAERPETTGVAPFGNAGRPPLKQPSEHSRGAASAVQAGGVTRVDHATRDSTRGATVACAAVGGSDQAEAISAAGSDPSVIETTIDDDPDSSALMQIAQISYGWTIEKAGASILQAERVLAVEAALRKRLQHPDPSSKTLAIYEQKLRLIDTRERLNFDTGAPKILQLLAPTAHSKQSFKIYRSALKHRAVAMVKECLSKTRSLRLRAGHKNEWQLTALQLSNWLSDLEAIDQMTVEAALDYSGASPKPAKSRRDDLLKLPTNWRQRFLNVNEGSPTYRFAGVLLVSTGLRPEELEHGVRVRYEPKGNIVCARIHGAKLRGNAGQPWRTLRIDAKRLPDWFVQSLMGRGTCIVRARANAMRTHLNRLTDRVFETIDAASRPALSAYLFRHAVVTDMQEAGWDTSEIAGAIGEICASTVAWYGLRRRRGVKPGPPPAIVRGAVRTARPVRPIDLTSMQSLIRKGHTKRAKR